MNYFVNLKVKLAESELATNAATYIILPNGEKPYIEQPLRGAEISL